MTDIAHARVRYGFWRIYILLRREGWVVNHKRVYRLYKQIGLNLRSKRPRRNRAGAHRLDWMEPQTPHQSWSMDFVADQLFDGRRFRALTVVDNYSRKCLAIHTGQAIKEELTHPKHQKIDKYLLFLGLLLLFINKFVLSFRQRF